MWFIAQSFSQLKIENGIQKEDYVYIALSLNYNLSSIKLNDKNVPNVTIQVNVEEIDNHDDTTSSSNDKKIDDLKEEIIEPWRVNRIRVTTFLFFF